MVEERFGVPRGNRAQAQREDKQQKRERKIRRGAKPHDDENTEQKALNGAESCEKRDERHASVYRGRAARRHRSAAGKEPRIEREAAAQSTGGVTMCTVS